MPDEEGERKLTCIFFGALLEAIVLHYLRDLRRHGFDVVDNQLVQIRVELLADTQLLADRVFGRLVHLKHINMLEDAVRDLPCDSKMIETLG